MRHMRSRRILAMLLALSMIFGLLTTTALADNGVDQNPSNVGESAANGTSAGGSGEGQPSGASEDESSTETNKEDVTSGEETIPEEKKTTSSEEVDTQVGEGENPVTGTSSLVVVNGKTGYDTLEAAMAAAEPVNGTITYTINGKVEVTSTETWIQILPKNSTASKVAFVGSGTDAEICIANPTSILADNESNNDIDVSFENLTLSHPNGQWIPDVANASNYFTCWLRDTNASDNTVTYTECTFPNGVCNNQFGKTVFTTCNFTAASGWSLWHTGTGSSELTDCTFSGARGVKLYAEGERGTSGDVTLNNVSLNLNDAEKAAVEITKPGKVTMTNVSVTGTTAGTIKKNFTDKYKTEDGIEAVTVAATGTGIGGTFEAKAENNVAKEEFNISAGSLTGEVSKDYLADGCTIDENGNVSNSTEKVVAKIGDATYTSLTDALANVTAGTPLTYVTEEAWPETTPVYYDGTFYKASTGFSAKGALELAIDAANNANSDDVAKIYVRPGYDVEGGLVKQAHQGLKTSIAIYGNNASLCGKMWEPCVEHSDTTQYHKLTKNVTLAMYNLNNGAGFWGYRASEFTANLIMENCENAHEFMFYGNQNDAKGATNITVKNCTFTKATAGINVICIIGAGDVAVEDCIFTDANINIKNVNGGDNTLTVKNSTFNNTVDGNQNIRVRGYKEETNSTVGIDSVTFTGDATATNLEIGEQSQGKIDYTIKSTSGSLKLFKDGATEATAETLDKAADYTGTNSGTTVAKGTEANPYTLEELGAMTRADYIAAQNRLGGTMYVSVGNYSYETNGTLGKGVRDDTPGQKEDRTVLNGYNSNGYLGTNNDGANGKSIVFVNGSITSGVTGYTSIDNIGTSLLLAVPAYTKVTFQGTTFNGVLSFDYQLYTGPWSQLGEINFESCKFNGIIVGAIASQSLSFNNCTFNNYENTISANSSNPTWIRPAYGNWTESDNDVQGQNFKSLTKINFTNNTVESTRPVKFEFISQWNNTTTLKATGNSFDIKPQDGDTETKNVGLYIGPHTDKNAVDLVLDNNTKSEGTAALYVIPAGKSQLPVGSTVTDLSGKQIEITDDALEWKTNTKVTLKTEPVPTETSIDLDTFLAWAAKQEWKVDGSNYTDNMSAVQGGKLVVKWSPVSGCYDTREGHTCTVNNAKATGNTPKRVNSSLTQFQILEGSSDPVTVRNVKFVYEPAAFTVCANSDWKGTFTAEQAPAGQLYFMTTGNVTFEDCDFDKVVLTTFETTGTSTVTNCNFANVYNNYAIKDIRGENVSVTDTTITNCGGGIMVSSTGTVSNVTLTGNTFTKVDVEGTAAPDKVGSRAILQFASSGDYAKATLDITSNKAENCGPALRQLNEGSEIKTAIKSMEPSLTSQFGENLYTSDSVKEMEDTDFFEDEQGVWHIATAAGLVKFADSVTRTNTYKDVKVVLDSNIDMSDTTDYMGAGTKDMLTTGTGEAGFEGTFDGQGHTISNLTVTNETSVYYTGLFYLLKGTVKNLTLDGAVCTGNRVAVLAGAANSCTVENVTVMNSKVNGVQKCAGLIGFIRGGCTVAIENCTVKNVTIKGLGDDGVWQAGGLVGFINTNTNATISNNSVSNIEIVDAYAAWLKEGNAESPQYSSHAFIGVIVNTSKTADAYENYVITLTGNTVDESASGVHKNETFPSNKFCGEYADCNSKTVVDAIYPTKLVIDGEELTALPVAEVGSNQYETLQAAINAAKSGATVKLLKDTKENVTISKKLTLDLNGKTLNGGQVKGTPALTVTAKGVTVKDSSADMSGTIMREDTADNSGVSSHYVIDIQGIGWLKFESGNVINNSGNSAGKGASLVRVGDDSVEKYPGLNIKGGNFKQDNFIAIKVDRGDLFLNGGTITSANSYAIENWFRATINGGTVKGTVASWTYSGGSNSTTTITGGTIDGDVASVSYGNAEGKTAKVTISGGTVNGELDTRSYDPTTNELTSIDDAAKATIGVTGGTFDIDPTPYVVEGSTVKTNSEGKYGVEKAYLCQIGETKYYTMEDAFKAQTTSGEAIVLLRDYTTGSSFSSGSINRTVDLNNHTWTYTGTDTNYAAFEINHPNVTLTVKNGTVVSGSMIGLISSASSLNGPITYDNSGLVFESVEATAKGNSGIETNGNNMNDTVTLKDSTLNVPSGFGIYFPSSGKLTIDNSKITAKTLGVQVCSGSLDIKGAETKIEVTGDGVEKTENDGAIQDGAAISIVNRAGYKGLGTIAVTEGIFTAKEGNAAVKAYDWSNKEPGEATFTASDKVAISGGSYSTVVPEDLCAEGFVPVTKANDAGLFEVTKDTNEAKIGNTKYATLADALKGATSGNTIVLLNDVTHATGFVLNDGILIDLNGHNLTTPFIFTSIEGGAGVVDTSNTKNNGGIGTLKVQFKKSVMNCTKVSGINGVYFPIYAGEEAVDGTTWYTYRVFRSIIMNTSTTTRPGEADFVFRVMIGNKEAFNLIKANPDQISIRLDVVLDDNASDDKSKNTYFEFNQTYVNQWVNLNLSDGGASIKITFTGLADYTGNTIRATASAKSTYTNTTITGDEMSVEVQ